jgi:hypothetical protein
MLKEIRVPTMDRKILPKAGYRVTAILNAGNAISTGDWLSLRERTLFRGAKGDT